MSTEFRVGMSEGRNSSRVLKPPGGGHSQIFGGPEEEEAPRKIHARTEISSCFGTESPKVVAKVVEVEKIEEKTQEIEENCTNGNGTVTTEETVDNNTNGSVAATEDNAVVEEKNVINEAKFEAQQTTTISAPERKRVPPGGFSSGGFW